jgi:hypothetical protein
VLSVLLALAPAAAAADSNLFQQWPDGFPSSANDSINQFHQVTDDFTLSAAATLDKVVFGERTLNLNGTIAPIPATVSWSIGTSPFTSNIGSGTATLTSTANGTASSLHDFISTFTLPNLSVAKGTYYLTLTDGMDTLAETCPVLCPHNNDYWSATSATSGDAQVNPGFTNPSGPGPLNNEAAFQIWGTTSSGGGGGGGGGTRVPEPETLLLLTGGLLSLVLSRRRPSHRG